MTSRILFSVVALVISFISSAQTAPVEIPLWPDGLPSSNGLENNPETADPSSGWTSSVSVPMLYLFPAENPNGMMVITCPGGGYAGLAMNHEGFDWAPWMNERGITYAVLKYRMPNGHNEVPLEDARRAMEIARERASEWGVKKDKIGVMGSSAGGHLAASLATLYGDAQYRPDFQILFYPVISMGSDTHSGSRDNLLGYGASESLLRQFSLANRVGPSTPPAIIFLSADDTVVPPSNSLDYSRALIDNCVEVELHMYPHEGHGWGFRPGVRHSEQMKSDFSKWLESIY